MQERTRAVLYLRLSKEDRDKLRKGDDSASIRNQRLLLTDYALGQDYQIVDVYSDDDESGLFDTRPEFERLLTDAKLGRFQVVIAKSQSRFSRNLEHVEKYLHHIFPNLGIRFIGVVDGADTADMGNKKSRQINGLVNEWYCEDLSANIRSAFRAKMKNGQYLGASCPYGYVKDPDDHNHLIVDEYAANVVRRIYGLYLKGYGKARIGRLLTEEGILIPTRYKREVLGIRYRNAHELDTTGSWSYQTVHTILNNEVYLGNVVQNRSGRISYKDKKHAARPREQWIRAAGMHEAVIDPDTFRKVQERQRIRTRPVSTGGCGSVFSGILICGDCKHAMVRRSGRKGERRPAGYCCKTYKTQGKKMCASHAVDQERLCEAVLHSIQQEARNILTAEDIENLSRAADISGKGGECRSQIDFLEKEIERRKTYKKKTYQNYMEEIISREEYISFAGEFQSELAELEEKRAGLESQLKEQEKTECEHKKWMEDFKNYISVDELTREMVLELIEKIEVNADGSINIYYKFKNR